MSGRWKAALALGVLLVLAVAGVYLYRTAVQNREEYITLQEGTEEAGETSDVSGSSGSDAAADGKMSPSDSASGGTAAGGADPSADSAGAGLDGKGKGNGPAGAGEISEYGPVATAGEEEGKRQPVSLYTKIAVLLSGTPEEEQGGDILRELLEEDGFQVEMSYAEGHLSSQRSRLAAILSGEAGDKGGQIVLLEPVDSQDAELGDLVRQLSEAGKPVVTYGDFLYGSDVPIRCHVGYDPYGTGQREAEELLEALDLGPGSRCNIEIFTGDMVDGSIYYSYPGLMEGLYEERAAGRLQVLSGQVELEQTSTFDWSMEEAGGRMRSLLSRYYSGGNSLDAVVCADERLARGVCEALREAGYDSGDTIMVTTTTRKAATESLRLSERSRILYLDGERLARAAEPLLYALGRGEALPVNNTSDYDNGSGKIPCLLLQPETL